MLAQDDEISTCRNGINQGTLSQRSAIKRKRTRSRFDSSRLITQMESSSRSVKKRSTKSLAELNPEKVRFPEIIKKFGYVLKTNDSALESNVEIRNEIDVDQTVFTTDLEIFLNKRENALAKQEFLDSMKFIFHSFTDKELSLCCQPTLSSASCEFSARGPVQDSLIQILLNCQTTQSILLEVLSRKLRQMFKQIKNGNVRLGSKNVSMASQIFHQFRCVVHIEDSEQFLSELIDIVPEAPVVIQKDILSIIPNFIVTLSEMDDHIVNKLDNVMDEETLQPSLIEALSQLSPSDVQITRFVTKVYESLLETPVENLPPKIKFMLEFASNEEECLKFLRKIEEAVNSVVDTIETLDPNMENENTKQKTIVHSTPLVRRKSIQNCATKKNSVIIGEIIDHIIRASRSNVNRKLVINCIAQYFEDSSTDFTVFNILLTIEIMTRVKSAQKTFEKILTQKVRNGHLKELQLTALLSTFNAFFVLNQKSYHTLVNYARKHLKDVDSRINLFVSCLYKKLFTSMVKELSLQREIVEALVISHILAGNSRESDSAFKILMQLTEENSDLMEKHSRRLTALLNHLNEFSSTQVSKTYRCLALASSKSAAFAEELSTTLKKQLSSSDFSTQSYGVIGLITWMSAVEVANDTNCVELTDNDIFEKASETLMDNFNQSCLVLVDYIKDNASSNKKCFAYFCDLLADQLCSSEKLSCFFDNISDDLSSLFEETFLLDVPPGTSLATSSEYVHCANYSIKQKVAVNLESVDVDFLLPLFRLMCVGERKVKKQEEMEDISALLGCAVYNKESHDTVLSQVQIQWLALNWFREVVNGFSSVKQQKNLEIVFSRLDTCALLNTSIVGAIRSNKATWELLPKVVFDLPMTSASAKSLLDDQKKMLVKTAKSTKTKKKVDKKPKDNDDNIFDKGDEVDDEIDAEESYRKESEDSMSKFYCRFMRQFDWETFFLLKHCKKNDEGFMLSRSVTVYLLKELNLKLSSTIPKGSASTIKVTSIPIYRLSFIVRNLLPVLQDMVKCIDEYVDILPLLISCCHMTLLLLNNQNEQVIQKVLEGVTGVKDSEVFTALFMSFDPLKSYIQRINDAVSYIQLLLSVTDLCPDSNEQMEKALGHVSDSFLALSWSKYDRKFLTQLLDLHFYCNPPLLDTVKSMGKIFLASFFTEEELNNMTDLARKGDTSTIRGTPRPSRFPCFNVENFTTVYSALLKHSCDAVKVIAPITCRAEGKEATATVEQWYLITSLFYRLLVAMSSYETIQNLKISLRIGRNYVDLFHRRALPMLKNCFKSIKIQAFELLTEIQCVAKFMQRLCSTSKVKNDHGLLQQVPIIRKKLSELLYESKALLSENECKDVMTIGTLKAKDIFGKHIQAGPRHSSLNGINESGSFANADNSSKRRRSRILDFSQSVEDSCSSGNLSAIDESEDSTSSQVYSSAAKRKKREVRGNKKPRGSDFLDLEAEEDNIFGDSEDDEEGEDEESAIVDKHGYERSEFFVGSSERD